MDALDRQLLHLLQENAEASYAELSKAVGLSAAGVHKRTSRLKAQGVITRTAAILERHLLGLDLLCFLLVKFRQNLRPDNLSSLEQAVRGLPNVLECYTLTGESDAILKVAVRNHRELRELLLELSKAQDVIERVQTCLVLEEFKDGTFLPTGAEDGGT